jgi:hypothetical protein
LFIAANLVVPAVLANRKAFAHFEPLTHFTPRPPSPMANRLYSRSDTR